MPYGLSVTLGACNPAFANTSLQVVDAVVESGG